MNAIKPINLRGHYHFIVCKITIFNFIDFDNCTFLFPSPRLCDSEMQLEKMNKKEEKCEESVYAVFSLLGLAYFINFPSA